MAYQPTLFTTNKEQLPTNVQIGQILQKYVDVNADSHTMHYQVIKLALISNPDLFTASNDTENKTQQILNILKAASQTKYQPLSMEIDPLNKNQESNASVKETCDFKAMLRQIAAICNQEQFFNKYQDYQTPAYS